MLFSNRMRLKMTAAALYCLFCNAIGMAAGANAHTIKGVVITPDGRVVPEFTIVVKQISEKPEMGLRKHFTDGDFTIERLRPAKYYVQISSPLLAGANLSFDLRSASSKTDYRIVILHPYRDEQRPGSDRADILTVKALQQKVPHAARSACAEAVELHRSGKLDEAMIEYGRALMRYPQYVEALSGIGSILLVSNRPQSALMFLRRAEDVDDRDSGIQLNIAQALGEQADYGGAIKTLKKILRREPQLATAQFLLAKMHYLQKKYAVAEDYVREALKNDPKLLEAWLLMIRINLEQQK